MPLSSCDDNRLSLAAQAEQKFTEARDAAKEGDYPRALECYLFAFDNSLAVSGWGGVRLSYIPSEIARLGVNYPPAIAALETRRDAREAMIRAGETDFAVVSEWAAINRYLKDKDRELALLLELENSGTLSESVKKRIVDENFERLLEQKKYYLLGDYFTEFGREFFMWIALSEVDRIFSEISDSEQRCFDHKSRIAQSASKVFELALGLGRLEQADGIVKQVLKYDDSVAAFKQLMSAAARAGKNGKVNELRKLAKSRLPAREYGTL